MIQAFYQALQINGCVLGNVHLNPIYQGISDLIPMT